MVRNSNKNETKFDYKDVSYLKKFVSEKEKSLLEESAIFLLKDKKIYQNAIKRARYLALMPYTGK